MKRITLKMLANLIAVGVVGLVATGWAVVSLLEWRPLDPPAYVTVRLAQSGGALPGAEVTYLGVPVGRVSAAKLVDGALELRLEVRPKGPMASELTADVRQKTSLGEPYVDLSPARPGLPAGDPDGKAVPIERTSTPRSLNALLGQTNELLAAIDPADIAALVEGAAGVVGHEEDLRALFGSGAELAEIIERRQAEFGQLLESSARLVSTLDAHGQQVQAALSGAARLSGVLAGRTAELERILASGADLGEVGSDLLARSREDLTGVLAGFDSTFRTLAERPQKLHDILVQTPVFVTRLGKTFSDHSAWSSTGGTLQGPYQPTYAMPLTGKGVRVDKVFLPNIAERIEFNFSDPRQAQMLRLISPEEAAFASQGPDAYATQERQEITELESGRPS